MSNDLSVIVVEPAQVAASAGIAETKKKNSALALVEDVKRFLPAASEEQDQWLYFKHLWNSGPRTNCNTAQVCYLMPPWLVIA